jgi:hypothetical protein
MTELQMLILAYAAFVADRTSTTPIEFSGWEDLSEKDQQKYQNIARAVVKEYQAQLREREYSVQT